VKADGLSPISAERQSRPDRGRTHLGEARCERLARSCEDRGGSACTPSISKAAKLNGNGLSDWAVWSVVERSAKQIGIEHFGVHDLRRTCAKLCRKAGGDLEQI
jgi:integrase